MYDCGNIFATECLFEKSCYTKRVLKCEAETVQPLRQLFNISILEN